MIQDIPIASLVGGMVIGASALMLLLLVGQVAGISGIYKRMFEGGVSLSWQFWFVFGLILSAPLYEQLFSTLDITLPKPIAIYMLAGLLVGIGTQIGNGCTSGHGICGIGRFSGRSIVATCTFMAIAMLTATLLYRV